MTDGGLAAVAAGCPNLQHLDLAGCEIVTDGGLAAVAAGSPNLQHLDPRGCGNVTDGRRTPTSTVGHWFSNWGVNTGLDLCRNPTRFPYFETGVKMTPCSNLMGAHLSLPQRWQTKGIGNRSKPLCVVTAQRASVRPIDRQSSESAVTALKAFTHVYVFVPLFEFDPLRFNSSLVSLSPPLSLSPLARMVPRGSHSKVLCASGTTSTESAPEDQRTTFGLRLTRCAGHRHRWDDTTPGTTRPVNIRFPPATPH